jgi:pectinesterase
MGAHIRPEGWNQWDRPNNPNTNPAENTRYFEFASTDLEGKPLDVSKRVPWSHQLTAEQAAQYTIDHVLGDWSP